MISGNVLIDSRTKSKNIWAALTGLGRSNGGKLGEGKGHGEEREGTRFVSNTLNEILEELMIHHSPPIPPQTGFLCKDLAVLELTVWTRMVSNSQRSICFCFPSAGLKAYAATHGSKVLGVIVIIIIGFSRQGFSISNSEIACVSKVLRLRA